jgi:hypothetical protein
MRQLYDDREIVASLELLHPSVHVDQQGSLIRPLYNVEAVWVRRRLYSPWIPSILLQFDVVDAGASL